MKIRDLSQPITTAKADWLAGTTWLGFTPVDDSLTSRNQCQSTIQRQYANGYVLEYITEQFSEPNLGFENDPQYVAERVQHRQQAGRLISVHKLRTTARDLKTILGPAEFAKMQDMWAQGRKRWRWSVAFPIVESYEIMGRPKAKDVFGEVAYRRLFKHPSATLRELNDSERAALSDLELQRRPAENAWIGIEDEFAAAEASEIDARVLHWVSRDLPDRVLEGMTAERRVLVRKRAAWLGDKFARGRRRAGTLFCDDCGFDPLKVEGLDSVSPRSLLDVHHKHPLAEGVRYTTTADFALLCPTCHRVEHERLKAAARQGTGLA